MISFDFFYNALVKYKEEFGDLFVPAKYEVNGFRLGNKVTYTRKHPENLSKEEFDKLKKIGFIWRVRSQYTFEEIYALLKEYKEEHGCCKISRNYTTSSGVNIGNILYCMLVGVTMTSIEEKGKIKDLGFGVHLIDDAQNKTQ